MNASIDKLKLDVTAISRGMVPIEDILEIVVPSISSALDNCESMGEANEIRAQAEAVLGYVKNRLPAEVSDKKRRLKLANRGNRMYLEVCRKAGALWHAQERFSGRPPEKRQKSTAFATAEQSGFRDRHDARDCEKAALVHAEDFRVYIEECNANMRQATLSGLAKIYDMHNPANEKSPSPDVRSLQKRLSDTAENILQWREEAGGDIYDLMTTAWEALCDAAEIARNNGNDQP